VLIGGGGDDDDDDDDDHVNENVPLREREPRGGPITFVHFANQRLRLVGY